MGFFKSDRSGGGNSDKKYGRGGFGGKSFGGRGNYGGKSYSAKPEMHSAICSECDRECEVPFKPIGDKPIFCRSCFKAQGDSSAREFGKREFGGREFGGREFGGKKSGGFAGGSNGAGNSGGITKEQYEKLNSKLDRILVILEANG